MLLGLYVVCVDGVFYMLIGVEVFLMDICKWIVVFIYLVKILFY